MGKRLAEVPRRNPRHAKGRHRLHLVEAQRKELRISDRIDVRIVGTGAVPAHEQRHRFVQVMHDRRMPLMKHPVHRLCSFVSLLMRVAVDVDERVLRPVGRGLARQRGKISLAFQKAVKPFDLLVASVGIRNRVDEDDKIFANAPDQRLFGHRQSIGKLEHGLG